MTSPHPHTIVLVTDDWVARVDMTADEAIELVEANQWDRADDAGIGDSVTLALRDRPRPAGNVWVLTDEVWSGPVSLNPDVAKAITDDQLDQALALEAEQESGISPFDSRLGFVEVESLEGQARWWVTQAERSQWDEIHAAVVERQVDLSGLAAIAVSLESDEPVSDWREGISASPESLAQNWLTRHLSDAVSAPIIGEAHAPAVGPSTRRWVVMAVAAFFLICFAVHVDGKRRLSRAANVLTEIEGYEKQLRRQLDASEALARRTLDVQAKRVAAQQAETLRRSDLNRRRTQRSAIRRRPCQVLDALAATADSGHWIQGIEMSEHRVLLTGVAVDSGVIAMLAQNLESHLGRHAWRVQPAKWSRDGSNDLVRFELTLIPRDAPADPPLSVAARGGSHEH